MEKIPIYNGVDFERRNVIAYSKGDKKSKSNSKEYITRRVLLSFYDATILVGVAKGIVALLK
ncbi:hypothetical protein KAJ87_02030 [Candidatus Pacearchaeota archaeon]|nr:hypothetical protein [Candidatus Pacearchaeota archaeon]